MSWKKLERLELISISLVGLRRSIGLEVWDCDPLQPVDLRAGNPTDSPLLEALKAVAVNWGHIPSGRGKVVWAELTVYRQAESGLPLRPRVPSPYPRPAPTALKQPDMALMERVREGLERL